MSLLAVYKYKTNEMHVHVIKLFQDIQLINIHFVDVSFMSTNGLSGQVI